MTAVGILYAKDNGRSVSVLVDYEMLPWLEPLAWFMGHGYARTAVRTIHGKDRHAPLHRLLAGLGPGDPLSVHHINGDRLDNRLANLALVTPEQHIRYHRSSALRETLARTGSLA